MSRIGVIIVCYGNICRSPLGEVMLRKLVADRGLEEAVEVCSAGYWRAGEEAHAFSRQVAKRRGLDLGEHRSQLLTPLLLSRNDLVLAMEEGLADRARNLGAFHAYNLAPYATMGADNDPVVDPVKSPLEEFEACAQRLEALLPPALDRLLKDDLS